VIAQVFYVGVQIMVWTFIIQYAENELGMSKADAQGYNMVAMAIFVTSRFICTFLLKYFKPSTLLTTLAIGGGIFTLGTIFIHGMVGLYSLVAISACMSLMFPTIYGIALQGMGDDAKLASAGLILAIGGGCLMPPLQGLLIDHAHWFGAALDSTRVSFVLPLICFIVIAAFGRWVEKSTFAQKKSQKHLAV
jgi:FHS family L-fucose permease-like MFS transporter